MAKATALRIAKWLLLTSVAAALLLILAQRLALAPDIGADNAYIFLAADRFFEGAGLTSIPPRAPLQPWEWQGDWIFLTQWPFGYPLMICAVRAVTGLRTAAAAGTLGAVSCAVALVAWFAWIRASLPRRHPASLLALIGAGASFSVSNLVNPASDTVLLAAMPLVLMLTIWACGWRGWGRSRDSSGGGWPTSLDVGERFETISRAPTQPRSWRSEHRQSRPQVQRTWATPPPVARPPVTRPPTLSPTHWGQERCAVGLWRMGVLGLAAGVLSWVRYAGVFAVLAIGLFLLVEWLVTRRVRVRQVVAFGLAAAVPLVVLVVVNRALGGSACTTEQFNLGARVGFFFEPAMLVAAWKNFTAQSLYTHRPEAGWFFLGVLPMAAVVIPLALRHTRPAARALLCAPHFMLSAASVLALLGLLLAANVLFHGKYDYVAQARYYQPVRPLYFLLFVGPLLAFGARWLRVAAWVPLVLAGAWFVNQDARRAIARWQAEDRPATEYGRWARRFEPGSIALYDWLATQQGDDLVVFSNFPEEIALETRIPACPTPRDRQQLAVWCARIRAARGVTPSRVLFVLDPDNAYRNYYLPAPQALQKRFDLRAARDVPAACSAYVFACNPPGG